MKKEKTFSLKDQLFNTVKIEKLAHEISCVYKNFKTHEFINDITQKLPDLELKERITFIAESLRKHLPNDYSKAIKIILKALPSELDPEKTDNDFGDFIYAPYNEFVRLYGCEQEFYSESIHALAEITKRFSAEDAIRAFINKFPDKTFIHLKKLSKSNNYHQRRLASEGSRLLLPWSVRINFTAHQVLTILNNLYFDKTRYVTRSVANSLNDISKYHPDLVFTTLENWEKSQKQNKKEFEFIKKHSLRTLLKQNNKKAMHMFGFTKPEHISLENFVCDSSVNIGEMFHYECTISSKTKPLGKLRIEAGISFLRKNNSHTEKKFHLSEKIYTTKKESFEKEFSFKLITTRSYYPGKHCITLYINGYKIETKEFELYSP